MIVILHKFLSITVPFMRVHPLSSSSAEISISSIDSNLGIRFKRILSFIPTDYSVADIGGDHGILTAALTNHVNDNKKIIYIDQSKPAVMNAVEYFKKNKLQTKVYVELGSGLEPLIRMNLKCECIVMAGMGSNTISKIVSQRSNDIKKINTSNQLSSSSHSSLYTFPLALDEIGVQKIIIQPYPPNLVPMLTMMQQLIDYGWMAEDQHIDQIGKYFYITTSFLRKKQTMNSIPGSIHDSNNISNTISINNGTKINSTISSSSSIESFEAMPLTRRYKQYNTTMMNTTTNLNSKTYNIDSPHSNERNIWKAYLHKYLLNTTPDNIKQSQRMYEKKYDQSNQNKNNDGDINGCSKEEELTPLTEVLHSVIACHIASLI